jgi:hypothetical protein
MQPAFTLSAPERRDRNAGKSTPDFGQNKLAMCLKLQQSFPEKWQ